MFKILKKKIKKVEHKEENTVRKLDYNTKVLFDKSKESSEFKKFKDYLIDKSVDSWNTVRRYGDYNYYFKHVLGTDIKDYISLKLKNKKNFSILEDGVGRGFFLNDLKKKFNKNELSKISFDGVVIDKSDVKKSIAKHIKLHTGLIENIKFTKKYDLMFSLYGSISYTLFHKDVLLKYLNHLKKGGILFLGYVDMYAHRRITNDFVSELKIALKKRGYEVKYQKFENLLSPLANDMPPNMFLIKKIK